VVGGDSSADDLSWQGAWTIRVSLPTFKKRAMAFAKLLLNIVSLDLLGTQFASRLLQP